MRPLGELDEGADGELQQQEHGGDDEGSGKGTVAREAVAEHVLRHRQLVGLEEVEPAEAEEHKNSSTHHADGDGATASQWMIVIHFRKTNSSFSVRRQTVRGCRA
jgi:hypothetical protein